jgi:uncharacterized membrane protein
MGVLSFTQPSILLLLVLIPLSILIALPRLRLRRSKLTRPLYNPTSRSVSVTSFILRSVMLGCIVLALSGVQTVSRNSKLAVAFLIDASDSVGASGREQALAYVRDALSQMRIDGNDQAAVVVFGADAQIERTLSLSKDLAGISAQVRTAGTNVESAIRLGLSLLPNDAARRLVLLSDGKQTSGDADSAARLVKATNARLDVIALPSVQGPDAAIDRVEAPQKASVGQVIPLRISVRSNQAQRAQLTVFSGPDIVSQESVNVLAGQNEFTVRANATRAGFSSFRVQLTPERDVTPQNNSLAASVIVGGPPRILLVSQPPQAQQQFGGRAVAADETVNLKTALTAAGINFEETTPRAMPSEIQSLASYQSIVLANVPARELSLRTMQSLQSYVRDIGGGLVAIGGPNSFGVGGYFKTPLEDTLPIESQVKDPKRFPSVAMVIVMDKSGSMGVKENGIEKMRIADEAAARVAEIANDDDELTVMAFDTQPVDVIGPFPGRDRAKYIPKILQIATGGGGIYILESIIEAERILDNSNKLTKFVILLADGNDSEHQQGAREVARRMRQKGIIMSVVASGDGSDIGFLKDIARIGEGRYHFTDRAANLPTIFTEEAAVAQRSYIVEEPFFPKLANSGQILNGIEQMPQLLGYIASNAKPSAQVLLKAKEDPLLTTWQYGLGRAVAFTSDATGRWGRSWVQWQDFPKFWAQTIRWTILDRSESAVQARLTQRGDQTVIVADLPNARADEEIKLNATVIDADGKSQQVALAQTAPGRFEADANLDQSGSYFVRVAPSEANDTVGESTLAYVKPYSNEYSPANVNGDELLKTWAALGGGELLDSPRKAFELSAPAAASRTDLAPWLMLIATLILPFDIGIRRIGTSLRKLIRRNANDTAPQPTFASAGSNKPLPRLMSVKARVEKAQPASQPRPQDLSAANRARIQSQSAQTSQTSGASVFGNEATPALKKPAPAAKAPQSAATAAELLRRKRKVKGDE